MWQNQNRFQQPDTCRCQSLLISVPRITQPYSTYGMCIETRDGHRNAFPLRFCLGLSFCDSFPLRFVEFPAEQEDLALDHWGTHRAGYDAVAYQVFSTNMIQKGNSGKLFGPFFAIPLEPWAFQVRCLADPFLQTGRWQWDVAAYQFRTLNFRSLFACMIIVILDRFLAIEWPGVWTSLNYFRGSIMVEIGRRVSISWSSLIYVVHFCAASKGTFTDFHPTNQPAHLQTYRLIWKSAVFKNLWRNCAAMQSQLMSLTASKVRR